MTDLGLKRAEAPELLGFSSARLEVWLRSCADVERKLIPGAVVLLARGGGSVLPRRLVFRTARPALPMALDSIFRIASMTKPMTSVAAMMLSEEGRLEIAAPVAQYLPEFAEMTVGVERAKGRAHDDGAGSAAAYLGTDLCGIRRLAGTDAVARRQADGRGTDQCRAGPEARGAAADVRAGDDLGIQHVDRRARPRRRSRLRYELGEFFATRIAGPLGMRDTGFGASGERATRVAEPQADPATGQRPPMRNVKQPGRWQSGGGGAVSTAADYLRFCQMLLNGGDLDGVRLLAPKTVALMASDHLPPGVGYGETARSRFGALAPVPEMGYGFGLGFAVRHGAGPLAGAGIGRRVFLGRRHRHLFLDRPARAVDRGPDARRPGPAPALPLPDPPARLRRADRNAEAGAYR